MEEIQQTLKQMTNYMNIVAIMTAILLCVFCFLVGALIIITLIDEIKNILRKKAKFNEAEGRNAQNSMDSPLKHKEKSQSENCVKSNEED